MNTLVERQTMDELVPTPYSNLSAIPPTGFVNIASAIAAIMSEIGVIGESGENKFQNYKYMSYKDLFRKLTPLMGKYGLAVIPTEKSKSLFDSDAVVMATYRFTIVHKSGEVWPDQPEWTGISRARDSKGGFDDKALNKCATAAQKYFLKALFQIPSGEDDEDPDNHDGSVRRPPDRPRVPSPKDAARVVTASDALTPHKLVGGTFKEWATKFIEAVGTAGDDATVQAWIDANKDQLAKLKAGSKFDYERANQETTKHREFLARTKAPDPISTGPTHPDIKTDYEGFLAWAHQQIATHVDPGLLETWWNAEIETRMKDIFPPDALELSTAYDKAQADLNKDDG